ncbi:toll/interleukin-1 receptor domain-containing protein [uncultured Thiodictyon sp.]|uniref:toll/interleukin-1 receptor domain-containing protein n=1 Tax=uncultured Thiodictyon sp. TaxID=1846217 RepID=UPI0025CFC8E7|nr:toll/interleukin-1 receptor domain-containing protein [uncultured Thiodictyon sp.]
MPAASQARRDRDFERPFELFVSYSHAAEPIKDRLLVHLAPLKRAGLISTWTDREIPPGELWRDEIAAAIERADGALFIVCADFLNSAFCMDEELPAFLARRRDAGTLVLFVLADHCNWDLDPIIKAHQMVPRDAKPITTHRPKSMAYTAVVREIHQVLDWHRKDRGLARRSAQPIAPTDRTQDALAALLAELPGATARLYGRAADLARLDTRFGGGPRPSQGGVLLWVAPGGVGKSALTRWWIAHRDWPAGTRCIGHSFYSQGSHNQSVSARAFLFRALAELGDTPEPTTSDYDLGHRLAGLAAAAPTLIALDGLEPLQQASADPKLNGQLKDQGLAALLEGLGPAPGQALCLASSRLPIPDPLIECQPAFHQVRLGVLPRPGAVELLAARGLTGTPDQLDALAGRCADHPLALVLAAELTHGFLDNQAQTFLDRDWPVPAAAGPDRHAATVMGWFDEALRDEHAALDRALVRVLGLFDRPAPWGAIQALKEQDPPIAGLTEPLHRATDAELEEALARLRQWGLADRDSHGAGAGCFFGLHADRMSALLDAHPLVREHFGRALEQEAPAAWRAAHGLLFNWFRALPEQHRSDTLEGLEPLYRAIGHGCRAGRYAQARREVYQDRILRGDQYYSLLQLGAISSDLSALAGFFPDGWSRAPVTGDLSEPERSWLIATVAYCLMSLGRLDEALGPRRMEREQWREAGDWDSFCRSSENLVDLLTPLGNWREAESVAREALETAGRVVDKDKARRLGLAALARIGRALQGQGRPLKAAQAFAKAEAVQTERTPHLPTLVGLDGFDYAQLLLEQARTPAELRAVLERARASLAIVEPAGHLVSVALDHCTIGQALARPNGSAGGSDSEAREAGALDLAIETMRRASKTQYLPLLYLTRAHHRRTQADPSGARADLESALAIATPPGMRTYIAEAALLAGQLALDRAQAGTAPNPAAPDPVPEAARHWTQADLLIRETGYARREAELHLLEARLKHHQSRPDEAHAALARAESRLRTLGQWGLWPQLVRVATELGLPDRRL